MQCHKVRIALSLFVCTHPSCTHKGRIPTVAAKKKGPIKNARTSTKLHSVAEVGLDCEKHTEKTPGVLVITANPINING